MDEPFTIEELITALGNLKLSSSPGADGITYLGLRHLDPKALQQLLSLCNQSSQIGRLEASWKIARIVAILKPGKPATAIDSYRPIALLSCIGKVMEKMVLERLVWDLENRDINPLQMSGFRRRGRSSVDNIFSLVSDITRQKAAGNIIREF